MARPAVVVALPKGESGPVLSELADAGFEGLEVASPGDLEVVLTKRVDIGVAILDGETDFDESLEYYSVLHDLDRSVATLMVVSQRALDRINANNASADDEYLTRPYSAESMRWRIEATFGTMTNRYRRLTRNLEQHAKSAEDAFELANFRRVLRVYARDVHSIL